MGDLSREMFSATDPLRTKLIEQYINKGEVPKTYDPIFNMLRSGMAGQTATARGALSDVGASALEDRLGRAMQRRTSEYERLATGDVLDALSRSAYTAGWKAPGSAMEGFGRLSSAATARESAERAADAQQEAAMTQTVGSMATAAMILALL
jgi:hypothetical protein